MQDDALFRAYFNQRMREAPQEDQIAFMLSPHQHRYISLEIERDFWRERYMALIAVREGHDAGV